MTLLLRRLYGIKSEKVDPRQGILSDEPAEETPPATNDPTPASPANESAPDDEPEHDSGE